MDEIAGCNLLAHVYLVLYFQTNSISKKVQGEEQQMDKPVR